VHVLEWRPTEVIVPEDCAERRVEYNKKTRTAIEIEYFIEYVENIPEIKLFQYLIISS
jgi:hypothetical protein